jgi:hypothetical protein
VLRGLGEVSYGGGGLPYEQSRDLELEWSPGFVVVEVGSLLFHGVSIFGVHDTLGDDRVFLS